MGPFPFQIRTTNPLFQSGGMVLDCQTADRTASNPWIMASPPAFSISALIPQTPAALPPFNLFTASLTSVREGGVSSTGGMAAIVSIPAKDSCLLGGSASYNCPKYSPQRDRTSSASDTTRPSAVRIELVCVVDLERSFFKVR